MPLPSVLNGAKVCKGISKRTKKPCKNPAAFGCRTCRMHGAHSSLNAAAAGMHWNFKHGKETREAKAQRSEASRRLHNLVDLGNAIGMFQPGTKLRGRRPTDR